MEPLFEYSECASELARGPRLASGVPTGRVDWAQAQTADGKAQNMQRKLANELHSSAEKSTFQNDPPESRIHILEWRFSLPERRIRCSGRLFRPFWLGELRRQLCQARFLTGPSALDAPSDGASNALGALRNLAWQHAHRATKPKWPSRMTLILEMHILEWRLPES